MRFFFTALTVIVPVATAFSPTSLKSSHTVVSSKSTTAVFAENGTNGANGSSDEKKKIIVLGGDGFCGWPTSLYLSDQGHDVIIVDNLSRRKIDLDLGCDSLTPIASPEVSDKRITMLWRYVRRISALVLKSVSASKNSIMFSEPVAHLGTND